MRDLLQQFKSTVNESVDSVVNDLLALGSPCSIKLGLGNRV